MKQIPFILSIAILLTMAACKGEQKHAADDLIVVDVTKNYPKKELILQDFMDVEYVPLETTDQFITDGIIKGIGKKHILIKNKNDGNIFVFDRATGKGLSAFNHMGQGPEEYSTQYADIVLDEENEEMFVFDSPSKKVLVYTLSGEFKRSFKFIDEKEIGYDFPFNYDRDHLICHKSASFEQENEKSCYLLISKKDGAISEEIKLPYERIKTLAIKSEFNGYPVTIVPSYYPIVPNHSEWLIMRPSSDTIYSYSAEGKKTPVVVRTPSIQEMKTERFLYPTVFTIQYCFMQTLDKINNFDFDAKMDFQRTDLMYDRKENAIFEYTVHNGDYSTKQKVSLENGYSRSHEVATSIALNAFDLVEANEKGKLKGHLKEIADKLDEEDNPVIMVVEYKQ